MSDMTNFDIDKTSRDRIVSEMDENFFVEAGAGSGKTTMLVNRMVAMVEAGKPIEKISAITFTKAAANEFYDRFQKLLIDRSNPKYEWKDEGHGGQLKKPDDKSRELCEKALRDIDLCFMGTIDSFCGMILSEHPSEAGIPSDSKIMTDQDAVTFYKQQYVRICKGEISNDLAKKASAFRKLYQGNAEKVFLTGMTLLMEHRHVNMKFKRATDADYNRILNVDSIYATDIGKIRRALKCLADHTELKSNKNTVKGNNSWEKINESYQKLSKNWSENLKGILKYDLPPIYDLRVIPEALTHYSADLDGVFEPYAGKQNKGKFLVIKDGVKEFASRMEELIYSVTMTFLEACVSIMEEELRNKGYLTYFDALYYLRNMLKKDAEAEGRLIRYIYNRHSYFLIDEFQDTNPMQAEIFFYLTAERPVEEWQKCIPKKGSLFIVGDPKQSIYRFRGADVRSFQRVKEIFTKNWGKESILSLPCNFRSTNSLCGYFNRVFTALMPAATEDQSAYQEIPLSTDLRENEFQGTYIYTAYTESLLSEHPEESNEKQIVKIIQKLTNNENYLIRTKKDKEPRPIRHEDFMVITGSKPKINPIIAELNKAGILTKVEGSVPFGKNEALLEICRIYASVADSSDAVSLYGALTGRLMGLTDSDLLKYRTEGAKITEKGVRISLTTDQEQVFGKDFEKNEALDSTLRRVASKISELRTLSLRAGRLTPAALFSEILEQYKIYLTAEAENLEIVYYTLELLRNAEKTGTIVSLKDGSIYLTKLLTGTSDEERCLSLIENRNAVHIANLHKIKGLEKPIVILSHRGEYNIPPVTRIIYGDTDPKGYPFRLPEEDDKTKSFTETAEYSEEKEAEEESAKAEKIRQLYVAATRARNALIICDSIQKTKNGERHASEWKPLFDSQGVPDFFASTSAEDHYLPSEKAQYAAPENLYREAEETGVLNPGESGKRTNEEKTYEVKNPSRQTSSKLKHAPDAENTVETDLSTPDEKEETTENASDDISTGSEILNGDDLDTYLALFGDEVLSDDAADEGEVGKLDTDPADIPEKEKSVSHRFPDVLGTMAHKLMEMLVSSGNRLNAEEAVAEIYSEFSKPSMEPYKTEIQNDLLQVATTMRNGGYAQDNVLPKDILNTLLSADEVHCEMPFAYLEESADGKILWNGIMDVVYRTGDQWHIVDYKTNYEGTNLDHKYRAQLEAYKKAFKDFTGQDADAYTYHIDI